MAIGLRQSPAPATSAKATPAAVAANPRKRKSRRYAKKKPKLPTQATTTTTSIRTHKPTSAAAHSASVPSDTWRRIAIDPELVALREVEAEGEGSGLIALEEISGRAFKGKVQVFTMNDVRAAAEHEGGEHKGGGRRKKRKRSELVPQLDVTDDEKANATREEESQQFEETKDDLDEQPDETVKEEDEDAVLEDEMDGEAEAAGKDQDVDEDGVEFDMSELEGEEDESTKVATIEAQRLLGQMRDDEEDDEQDDEEAESEQGKMESEQMKEEQEEQAEDEDEPGAPAALLHSTNKLSQPDLSSPPPATPWDSFDLHPLLLHSLHTLGFHTPTPVQSACLPSALLQRRDIIAAAETGSGKTLTFALPILNGLLLSPPAVGQEGVVALVLVPTRELALQVAMHVRAAAQYMTSLRCCVLVGGLSQQKQLRQLAAHPHILIATPGRLCELIVEGEVKGWHTLRYLVLDEADRMVERGLGAEVQKVMTAVDRQRAKVSESGGKVAKLQHFFFSATLALPDVGRENLKLKKQSNKRRRTDGGEQEDEEAGMVGYFRSLCSSMMGSRPHVVDLTSKRRLVGGLSEYVIPCVTDDKDFYVYALLLQQPADTKLILFVNAISCLRRLSSILTLMTLPVYPLHAEMQQRQRLKNLDRFTAATTSAILLCTDVAARGLDLPAVPMVVHYQLPGSADVYIHRVGRTARAGRVGVSVALVSEEDGRAWHRINTVVRGGSNEEVERWKVDDRTMAASRERMTIARKLDRLLNKQRQQKHNSDWLQRQAQEMDMIVDDDLLQPGKRQTASRGRRGRGGDEEGEEDEREEARRLQKELTALLKRRMGEEKKHARFFTLNVVEEMEARAEEQKKRLSQQQQEKKKKQNTAATPRDEKSQATKPAHVSKAKVETGSEASEQSGVAVTSDGVEQRVKVETHSVEEQKVQQSSGAGIEHQQVAVQKSVKPASATQTKQPAKQLVTQNGVVRAQTNGHSQHTEEQEEDITEARMMQSVTAPAKDESVKPAAVVTVNIVAEATHSESAGNSSVEQSAAGVGDAAGEMKKLGKRAKKNLRKQKQKLAAAAIPDEPAAQPHT